MNEHDHKEFVREHIEICRRDVDRELHEIRIRLETHTLTEEQAEAIAVRAAEKAIPMTRKGLVDDVKMEIANSAITILRNALKVVAVFIVGLAFYIGSIEWSKTKLPWVN